MNKPKNDAETMSGIFFIALLSAVMFWLGSAAYGLDHVVITFIASLFSAIAGYRVGKLEF